MKTFVYMFVRVCLCVCVSVFTFVRIVHGAIRCMFVPLYIVRCTNPICVISLCV